MTTTAPRAPRPTRESTFLDEPSLYPEYEALTSGLPRWHALRRMFHVHRTASLLLLVAVCMAASGVPVPPTDGTAAASEWLDFAYCALAIDRLVDHFEGLTTGLAAMGVIALVSILVYPLHSLVTTRTTTTTTTATPIASSGGSGASVGTFFVVAAIPSTAIWTFAVWVQGRCAWALGPGLWFALFCACVTLKITSFVASAPCTLETSPNPASPSTDVSNTAAPPLSLTFGEYLFFVFQSPSLVCEIHLMKLSARRKSRPLRALSEFFHSMLTFLCAHCLVGTFLAPSMRLFLTGFCPRWVESAGAGWAELEADGGAGWPSWIAGSALLAGGDSADKGLGPVVTLGCFLWMTMVVSSVIHFLVFYAFWHCLCLGMAELWGFPDRNLYGCWWLLFDEPREFLRMWSVPVHRWLCACVHWPMLELARGTNNGGTDGGRLGAPWSSTRGAEAAPSKWTWLPAVLATFVVSGVFHEAVVYVAMRGTCWPFNTFLLCVAGLLVTTWDVLFPILCLKPSSKSRGADPKVRQPMGKEEEREQWGAAGRTTGGSSGGGVKVVRAYGHRGFLAVVVFNVLVQLSPFICDCAAWLWWRHIHMKE